MTAESNFISFVTYFGQTGFQGTVTEHEPTVLMIKRKLVESGRVH